MSFVFEDDFTPGDDMHCLRVPAQIEKPQELLDVFTAYLLPDYRCLNWYTILEAFVDFHWASKPKACILHEDVPLQSNAEVLEIYMHMLHRASELAPEYRHCELLIVFPARCREFVEGRKWDTAR